MLSRHSKCGCGADIVQCGPGRPRLKCDPCRNPPPKPKRVPKGPYVKLGPQETTAICAHCISSFTYMRGRGRKKRFCSDECRAAFHEGAGGSRPCAQCGAIFTARLRSNPAWGLFCSRECRVKSQRRPEQAAENARKCSSRRRARKKGATIEHFTHLEVFERDGWKCGLCGKRVDRKLAYPHPMSASLDHIVPLCDGGDHSLRNSQCSHWICNSRKTFGAGGQMRLFG